ncbi:MAG: hypothetical protein GF329_03820 [Candidatus Lokiarchaeota archaeon]|nr:hypothetical protein [Candidatus Lokiarchaeota archaeon]
MKNKTKQLFSITLILTMLLICINLTSFKTPTANKESNSSNIAVNNNLSDPWALETNGSVFSSLDGSDPWTFTGNTPTGYDFISVAADNNNTYGLTNDGQIWRHSNNSWGTPGWSKLNVPLPNKSNAWVSIDVSITYLYVLNANGSVYRILKDPGWPNPGTWVIGSRSLHKIPPPPPATSLQTQPAFSFVSLAVDWNDSFCFVLRNNGEVFRHECDSSNIWGFGGNWTDPNSDWWIYQSYGNPTPYALEHGDGVNQYWNHPSTGWVSIDVYDNYIESPNYSVFVLHNSGLVARKNNIAFAGIDYWMMPTEPWIYDFRWALPFDDWNILWLYSTAFESIACNDDSIFIMQNTGMVWWIYASEFEMKNVVFCNSWLWNNGPVGSPLLPTNEVSTSAFVSIDAWTEPFILKNDGKAWRCLNYTFIPPWQPCGDNDQNNGKGTLYPSVFSYSSITAFNLNIIFVLSKNGTIYNSTDGGVNWKIFGHLGYGNDSAWVSIASANHKNHSYIYALYNNGTVVRTTIRTFQPQAYGFCNTVYPFDTSWVSIALDGNATAYTLRNLGLISYKIQGGSWISKGITIGNYITGFSHPQDSSWVGISAYHFRDGVIALRNDIVADYVPAGSSQSYINIISSAAIDSSFVEVTQIPNNYLMLVNTGDVFDSSTVQIGSIGGDTGFVDITYFIDNFPWDNNPPDQLVNVRSSQYTITWNIYDDVDLLNYTIYRANSFYTDGMCTGNGTIVQINPTAIRSGVINYTITYNDTFGQTSSDTVFITIDFLPWDNDPNDISTSIVGSETIDWRLYDDWAPSKYQVIVNGSESNWSTWTNATNLQYPINRTIQGVFNYTIKYNDSRNQFSTDQVWVTITDQKPQSNQPATPMNVLQGSNSYIDWILTDDAGTGKYRVIKNHTPGLWSSWTNDTSVHHQIDTSITGTINYTIQYNDSSNQFGNPSTVIVNVINNPPQSNHPASRDVDQNTIAVIDWVLTDDIGAGHYRVIVNQTPGVWTAWQNNTAVNIPIDTTTLGVYNYTIVFNDSYGNLGNPDTVIITVKATTTPTPPIPGFMFYLVVFGIISLILLKKSKKIEF